MEIKRYDALLLERYFEDWKKLPADKLKSLIRVKAKNILPSLDEWDFSKQQRVKCGFDPTGTDLHVGHLCPSILLNLFIKAGHHVTFVIGDFTAKIGDPSGRVTERAIMTDEVIAKNFQTYADQVGKYIDLSKLHVRKNSEWLAKTSLADFIAIHQNINLATSIQREDFRIRLEAGGVTNAEILYASLMGLDSVALETTIELGGDDQLLNLQQCRLVQKIYGQKPELIITNPLIEGTDGRKMSKSYQNYIALNATPEDKFGKFMSIADNLLMTYYKAFGYLYEDELPELEAFIKKHPMEAKKQLATYFVSIEGKDLAIGKREREHFEKKFAKKELSDDDFVNIKVKNGTLLIDALMSTNLFKSRGELKTLLKSNAIRNLTSDSIVTDDVAVTSPVKLKVGKMRFISIVLTA